MRYVTKYICGADRVLCYSLRVMKGVTEKFGKGGIREHLTGGDPAETMDTALWLLHALMDAGKRYADSVGIDCPPAPTEDELLDTFDVNDLMEIQTAVTETMTAGSKQEVKAEPLKNGEARAEES